jgi:urea transport system ATP-binding protein
MSNTDFVLAVEDLTVSFDGFKAIDALTLYVDRGELRVIIGPNGAGKTTLLDLICGKTRASTGSIKFKNQEMTKMSEHKIVRSGIGRKFQTPSIYENLSVFKNLEVSFPRGRSVFGALASGAPTRCASGCRRWPTKSASAIRSTSKRVCCRTARSSGWRSACC